MCHKHVSLGTMMQTMHVLGFVILDWYFFLDKLSFFHHKTDSIDVLVDIVFISFTGF